MDDVVALLTAPTPVGLCWGNRDFEQLRTTDLDEYVRQLVRQAHPPVPQDHVVTSVWRAPGGDDVFVWCTGITFEKLCAVLRHTRDVMTRSLASDADARCADQLLECASMLTLAAELSTRWEFDGDVFEAMPELTPAELTKAAEFVTLAAHMTLAAMVTDLRVRAGLFRAVSEKANVTQGGINGSGAD